MWDAIGWIHLSDVKIPLARLLFGQVLGRRPAMQTDLTFKNSEEFARSRFAGGFGTVMYHPFTTALEC